MSKSFSRRLASRVTIVIIYKQQNDSILQQFVVGFERKMKLKVCVVIQFLCVLLQSVPTNIKIFLILLHVPSTLYLLHLNIF